MANVKISQLPALSTLTGPDVFPVVSSGVTYNVTATEIASFTGGNATALNNGTNSFVLDANGNVVFQGAAAGEGINRGMVWDYGADNLGVNSEILQDGGGLTVRAYTEDAGNISASVNIVTNQGSNKNEWIFSGEGNLTLPGNIQSEAITDNFAFTSDIIGITTGNPTVVVTIADSIFEGSDSGTVTISGVTGTSEANGIWGYQAVEVNQFQLFTDDTLTTPVDGTAWTTYIGGGTAVAFNLYANLTIRGGNVAISSDNQTWTFDIGGNLILPINGTIVGNTTDNPGSLAWVGDSSGDGLGYTTLELVPDSTRFSADQYLILDPTAPGHIHIRAGGVQDNSQADLILGGENSFVKIAASANPDVFVRSNSNDWRFGTTGILSLPGEGILQSTDDTVTLSSFNTVTGNANSVYLGTSGGLGFNDQEIGGNWLEIFRNGAEPEIRVPVGRGNLNIQTAEGNTAYNWTLDNTGNLTLPGNTFAVNYANGDPVTIGGGSGTGDITFVNTTISAPNEDDINIQALNSSGVISSGIAMRPGDTYTRLEQWGSQDSQSFTTADWATGVYTTQAGGSVGAVEFTDAQVIIDFVNSLQGAGQITFSVNGGPRLLYDGDSSGGGGITFYTPTLPATDPTTVTTFEYYYSYNSRIEIDYDAEEFNIEANKIDININTRSQGRIEINSDNNLSMNGNGTVSISNQSNTIGVEIRTDSTSITSPAWSYGIDGSLALATVSSESAQFVGTRRIIGGLSVTSPYSATLAAGTPTVAYTATAGTQSVKITFAVQSNGAGFQWEQFDVVATPSGDAAVVNFVVSNRVKSLAGVPDTVVTATVIGQQMQISLTLDITQTSGGTSSFDAVEFGLMVD